MGAIPFHETHIGQPFLPGTAAPRFLDIVEKLRDKKWVVGDVESFEYGEWLLTLRRETKKIEPYLFTIEGRRKEPSDCGTFETLIRRYESIDSALLHIFNRFNENSATKNPYSSLSEAITLERYSKDMSKKWR